MWLNLCIPFREKIVLHYYPRVAFQATLSCIKYLLRRKTI